MAIEEFHRAYGIEVPKLGLGFWLVCWFGLVMLCYVVFFFLLIVLFRLFAFLNVVLEQNVLSKGLWAK